METAPPPGAEDAQAIVTDLIARKEHARAIEFLRTQFKGRSPGTRMRLELADVLVLAGKGDEAVPILVEVTGELLARGSVATAMAALKKVEQLEPQESRLEKRVASILGRRGRARLSPSESPPPSPAAPADENAKTQPLAAADVAARLAQEPARTLPDEDTTAPLIVPPDPPSPPPTSPEGGGGDSEVSDRMRTAVRRFLAALPGQVGEQGREEGGDGESGEEASGEAPTPPEPGEGREDPAVGEPPREPIPPMSTEDFRAELLNLVRDLAHRPEAPETVPEEDLKGARNLKDSPLFRDLSPAELAAVLRGLRLHNFEGGDIVLTEGERGDSVYIVAKGLTRISVRNPEGRNFPVGEVREGEFFGEIGSLSGRPRSATVTAAGRCELLEIDKRSLDDLAREHPRAREVLEELYIRRASSPEAAAVRAVPLAISGTQRKAMEVLESHFGEGRWDPRMRLRLAAVLLRAGKYEESVPILVSLADGFARQGFPERAIAVLKRIEMIQRRHVEELRLAPRPTGAARDSAARAIPLAAGTPPRSTRPNTEAHFQDWLVDVVRKTVSDTHHPSSFNAPPDPAALRAYVPGLLATPLFAGFSGDELLAVMQELRLLAFEPGDIVVTQGEPGESVFIVAAGAVKVFTRDPSGHDQPLAALGEGSFFGEISTLSGRPRTATVTAAARCELLELERAALHALDVSHPHVREVLEAAYQERAPEGGLAPRPTPS